MTEWQPIETAPKDGTSFLIPANVSKDYRVATVCYVGGYDSGDIWFEAATGTNHYFVQHWAPLPSPPKTESASMVEEDA